MLKNKIRNALALVAIASIIVSVSGCAMFKSELNSLNGSITGNTYECQFYSNDGNKFMTLTGQKIDIGANTVKEKTYNDGSWGYTETLSSVVTITVDGHQMSNCGSTVLFIEKGLEPDVDFQIQDIDSEASGVGDNTIIANAVNKYKNMFGKPVVVVIQSQLGDPICAFSGNDVYWEVCQDIPKTTKLMIDGHALYIHRANFQLIDKDLLG
jgi:hypothetical protein